MYPVNLWIAESVQHFVAAVVFVVLAVTGFGFYLRHLVALVAPWVRFLVWRVASRRALRRIRPARYCYSPGEHPGCDLPPAPSCYVKPPQAALPAIVESPSWGLGPLDLALEMDEPSARAVSDAVEQLIVSVRREIDGRSR